MTTIQFDIVHDLTAMGSDVAHVILRNASPLPKDLIVKFRPDGQMDVEPTHFVSHANSQVMVAIPRSAGMLTFFNRAGDVIGNADIPRELFASHSPTPVRAEPAAEERAPENDQPPRGGDDSPFSPRRTVVRLERTDTEHLASEHLYAIIRRTSERLSFERFSRFVDLSFCDTPRGRTNFESRVKSALVGPGDGGLLREDGPAFRVDSYDRLKTVAEVFLLANTSIVPAPELSELVDGEANGQDLSEYLGDDDTLPYLRIVYERLGIRPPSLLSTDANRQEADKCRDILERKSRQPCLIELIWSYWHEEAMQVQAMAAVTQRFQNLRAPGQRDPLAALEIDPLRPLNHLLWKHTQGESDRLSVLRRAHEYEHEYGFPLHGKAVASLRPADRSSKFLEAFHNLLYRCVQFFREDDDTTHVADGFPVLNALKETHYVLSRGAHNQFGDLPVTARQEMLIEQWLLARPEMREFLGSRPMVAYPESWMDRVDTVKTLKGWNDVSVVHFHDLAVFGEQLLLSIRWNNWSKLSNPAQGKVWARTWRPEIQGYIHGIRAALGIDLAAEITNTRDEAERYLPPSVHLRRRLQAQQTAR